MDASSVTALASRSVWTIGDIIEASVDIGVGVGS